MFTFEEGWPDIDYCWSPETKTGYIRLRVNDYHCNYSFQDIEQLHREGVVRPPQLIEMLRVWSLVDKLMPHNLLVAAKHCCVLISEYNRELPGQRSPEGYVNLNYEDRYTTSQSRGRWPVFVRYKDFIDCVPLEERVRQVATRIKEINSEEAVSELYEKHGRFLQSMARSEVSVTPYLKTAVEAIESRALELMSKQALDGIGLIVALIDEFEKHNKAERIEE